MTNNTIVGFVPNTRVVYDHWTGLVDWTGGLDWWTDIYFCAKMTLCSFIRPHSPEVQYIILDTTILSV